MRAFRRILVVAVLAVAIAVPVAAATIADPFGAVEVVDPVWRPWDLYLEDEPILGVDAAEMRCSRPSSAPAATIRWRSTSGAGRRGTGRRSARRRQLLRHRPEGGSRRDRDGRMASGRSRRHAHALLVSATARRRVGIAAGDRVRRRRHHRPVRDSDNGAAIAAWGDGAGDLGVEPTRGRRVGRAGADRGRDNIHDVAMSATGDAVVVCGPRARIRVRALPAGRRSWGADTNGDGQRLLEHDAGNDG